MSLSVPQPMLSQKGAIGNRLVAEKPIDLSCGPVSFPDWTILTPENAVLFGFLVYRERPGGITEVWDEKARSWIPDNALPDYQPLFPSDRNWKSILVAIGQKDHTDQVKFGTNRLIGFPRYFIRCFFKGKDALGSEHVGHSPPSQFVEILGIGEQDRAGLAIEPKSPAEARQISLFLKDSVLAERGKIVIREDGGGFLIELQVNGARLEMSKDGGIVLFPAPGQRVRVEGDLSVNGAIMVSGTLLNVP